MFSPPDAIPRAKAPSCVCTKLRHNDYKNSIYLANSTFAPILRNAELLRSRDSQPFQSNYKTELTLTRSEIFKEHLFALNPRRP